MDEHRRHGRHARWAAPGRRETVGLASLVVVAVSVVVLGIVLAVRLLLYLFSVGPT